MIDTTKKELEELFLSYTNKIEKIALREFNKHIKPFLQLNSLHFLVGNGTYVIYDDKNHTWYEEDLPKSINEVLQMEIPISGNSELGLWMIDFHPKEN